jgi:hypothetical protein
MEILVEGEGTLTFWWKVSCDYGNELQFLLDGQEMDVIDEDQVWHQMQYNVTGSGIHSFLWQYVQDVVSSGNYDDCGYVDSVEWTGSPPPEPSWDTVDYKYDPSARAYRKGCRWR